MLPSPGPESKQLSESRLLAGEPNWMEFLILRKEEIRGELEKLGIKAVKASRVYPK